MNKCYFITGTDTEIGKTVASVALLQAAQTIGLTTAGYKPVASGKQIISDRYLNSDVLALLFNSSISLSYEDINFYTFIEPTSPHIASVNEKKLISLKNISSGLHSLKMKAELVLVEGVGGWFTPLSETITFADWVIKEQLPIILVVGIKLGCINHAMLTTFAILKNNLCLSGWIANEITKPDKYHKEYLETLKRMIPAPFLGFIPRINNINKYSSLGIYVNLSKLLLTNK